MLLGKTFRYDAFCIFWFEIPAGSANTGLAVNISWGVISYLQAPKAVI